MSNIGQCSEVGVGRIVWRPSKVAGSRVICRLPSRVFGSGVNARKVIGAGTVWLAFLLAAL